MFTTNRKRTLVAPGNALVIALCFLVSPAVGQFGGGGPGGQNSRDPGLRGPDGESFRSQIEGKSPIFSKTGAQTKIVDVRIIGNETVSADSVQSHLKTKKDRSFDPEVVQDDVRRLTTSGQFRHIRTFTQQANGGVVVTFEVLERPTIREILFHGNRAIQDKALLSQSGLEIGDALILYNVEESRRKIEEYYQSQGFAKAQVFVAEGNKPEHRRVVLKIHEGVQQRIGSVDFVGNSYFSESRLKTQIKSKSAYFYIPVGAKLDHNLISEDAKRLTTYYRNLGFFNASVGRELKYNAEGKWVDVKFVINEGPRYKIRNISIAGNTKFQTDELLQRLSFKSGEMFNLGQMQRDVSSLRDIYGGNGYIFADVQADTRFLETSGELDLVYNITEGDLFRIGAINVHIQGEFPHTRRTVVLNRLSFRPGDIVDIREVRSSERRLKSSQLFENNPGQGSAPRIVVRPPDAESIASRPHKTHFRGQSPDGSAAGRNKLLNIDIYVPAVKIADKVEQLIPWRQER